VEQALERHVESGSLACQRLVVGFSGGMDSSVLLHSAAIAARGSTVALHVNHGISPSAADWQRHCEAVCASARVPLTVRNLDIGGTVSEAVARAGRYAVFEDFLAPGDVLLLAHHAQDHAETVLLHLFQGRGVYGMPARRPLGAGWLVRPFLHLDRRVLSSCAADAGLDWVEDAGNEELAYDRNFLRHRVLPVVEERFSGLSGRIGAVAGRTAQFEQLLVAGFGLERRILPTQLLTRQPPGAQVELILAWLRCHGTAGVSTRSVREFARQLGSAGDRQPALQLADGWLRRYRNAIHMIPPQAPPPADRGVDPPAVVAFGHGRVIVERAAAGFEVAGSLRVCFGRRGRLLVNGHHRPVAALLREAGIPPWERPGYPLLYDDNGLVAVPSVGVRDQSAAESAVGATDAFSARWSTLTSEAEV
jgi:tRNA(Ile)-lysidine synthase